MCVYIYIYTHFGGFDLKELTSDLVKKKSYINFCYFSHGLCAAFFFFLFPPPPPPPPPPHLSANFANKITSHHELKIDLCKTQLVIKSSFHRDKNNW